MGHRSIWIENNGVYTHFALGNTKLGLIPSISLPPGIACPSGVPCFKEGTCYALHLYKQYRETRNCWDTNFAVAKHSPLNYFDNIAYFLEHHCKSTHFRWHVAGDILNQNYLLNMKHIANAYKSIQFLSFTKNYELHYSNIPSNLHIVFSAWPGLPLKRKSFPVVWMRDKAGLETRIPRDALKCRGHCEGCTLCWKLNKLKKDAVILEH